MSKIESGLRYTKDHEWAQISGTTATIGITDHAQAALGDIVYLELPKVGRVLKKGEAFGVVESIKAVSDLYSPVDGKVIEANQALASEPSKINSDPYLNSWMVKIELSGGAPSDLMDAEAYRAHSES